MLTVMGEQFMPIIVAPSCTVAPANASADAAAGESARWTLLQHWIGPVLQDPSSGQGMAAARMAKEDKRASLESMLEDVMVNRVLRVQLDEITLCESTFYTCLVTD